MSGRRAWLKVSAGGRGWHRLRPRSGFTDHPSAGHGLLPKSSAQSVSESCLKVSVQILQ